MRTTITLDPDVAARLKAVARERGISFKEAVNTALRRGLGGRTDPARPYKVEPRRLGLRPGIDLDRALLLVDELEDAETIRKLELRK
jgi:hypothetical protein